MQRIEELETEVKKLRGELEGMWAHIRALEEENGKRHRAT